MVPVGTDGTAGALGMCPAVSRQTLRFQEPVSECIDPGFFQILQATTSLSCMDSRVSVRGLTPTRQRVIPRCCMGARLKSHVVTGLTSLISLESGREDEVFKLYMGFGCRLYLAGSPRCPANMYNSGRKGMTQSLMSSLLTRNRLCISALAPSVAGSLEAYSCNPSPAVAPADVSAASP